MEEEKHKHGKLKKVVEKILENDSRARVDSAWLLYMVWRNYTKIFIPFDDIKKLPKPESIFRCKRMIQNQENKYNEEYVEEGVTFHKPLGAKQC